MKGPSRKEDTQQQKVGTRLDYEKLGKAKRVSSSCSGKSSSAATFDEAKACCKARKRKERQESISSLCQERKVIRSNSEERPTQRKYLEKKDIRRVSSHEDFHKSTSTEKISESPNKYASHDKTFAYEDYEHEKRRSHERFSRPLALRSKRAHPNKRLKVRYVSRTKFKPDLSETSKETLSKISIPQGVNPSENDTLKVCDTSVEKDSKACNFLTLHCPEIERSPSPENTPVTPVLDLKTLHEQIDCAEPVLSVYNQHVKDEGEIIPANRYNLSPRNSLIATHRIYLDPDIPQYALDKKPKNPVDERLQKLNKEINSLKKKIKKSEAEFEAVQGFKASHVDKLNDKSLKKLYSDLGKLRKDQKQLTDVSGSCLLIQSESSKGDPEESTVHITDTLAEIEKQLQLKRESESRGYNLEEMTSDQLMDEKIAIQKALLYLESVHGRPNNKEDRDLVRPFYDRYRTLKRMLAKVSTQASIELATIHEDETMNFKTPTAQAASESESEKPKFQTSTSTDSDTDTSISENYHSMSKEELVAELKIVMEEKKEIRRNIKEFESEIQQKTGRMIQKEDKLPMEFVYMSYKKFKAKLRLLEALLGKDT